LEVVGKVEKLTVEDILSFAMRIEEESFRFYRTARDVFGDDDSSRIMDQLAQEETNHINWLRELLEKPAAKSVNPEDTIGFDTDLFKGMIIGEEIHSRLTTRDILNIALEREKKTMHLYDTMHSMSSMNETVRDTFRVLREQEQSHVHRVQKLLRESEIT